MKQIAPESPVDLSLTTPVLRASAPRRTWWFAISVAAALSQLPGLIPYPGGAIHWLFVLGVVALLPPLCLALFEARTAAAGRLFLVVLSCYAILHFSFELVVYETGFRMTRDTGAFVQSFWNLANGNGFQTTIDGQYSGVAPASISHFARHNSPILFVGYLFYRLFGSMVGLIVLKTLLWFLAGWLALRLAKLAFPGDENRILVILVPFVLLIQVPLAFTTDFDETVFYPPIVLWLALSYKREARMQFVLACLLLAAVKETTVLILFVLGILALWRGKRWEGGVALVTGALAALISFGLVIPAASPTASSPFFQDVSAALAGLRPADVGTYWLQLLGAWAALPLGSLYSLLGLPEILMNSFFAGPMPWTLPLTTRYQVLVDAVLFVAAIDALPRAARWCEERLPVAPARKVLLSLLFTAAVCGLYRAGLPLHALGECLAGNWHQDVACLNVVARDTRPVIADYSITGYFAERRDLWTSGLPLPEAAWQKAEWVVSKKRSPVPLPLVGLWDTVCSSQNLAVLRRAR
ncbi:MAG TPA: DUF2079 domain-containing protein [Bacteroidota bacterium]